MRTVLTPIQSHLVAKVLLLISRVETMCDLTIKARAALAKAVEPGGTVDDFSRVMDSLAANDADMKREYNCALVAFRDVEDAVGAFSVTYKPPCGSPRHIASTRGTWNNFCDFMTERASAIGEREALHAELRKRLQHVFAEIDAYTPHRLALRLYGAWNPQHCSGSLLEDRLITDDHLRARRSPYT